MLRKLRRAGIRSARIAAGIGHTARPPDPQERYYACWMGSDGSATNSIVRNTGVRVDAGHRGARLVIDGAVQYDFVNSFITPYAQARKAMVPGVMNASARSFADVDARIAVLEARGSYSFSSRWSATATTFYTRGTKRPDPSRESRRPPCPVPLSGDRPPRSRLPFGEAVWAGARRTARRYRPESIPDAGKWRPVRALACCRTRATVALQNISTAGY
jgi:hypothetical protein